MEAVITSSPSHWENSATRIPAKVPKNRPTYHFISRRHRWDSAMSTGSSTSAWLVHSAHSPTRAATPARSVRMRAMPRSTLRGSPPPSDCIMIPATATNRVQTPAARYPPFTLARLSRSRP